MRYFLAFLMALAISSPALAGGRTHDEAPYTPVQKRLCAGFDCSTVAFKKGTKPDHKAAKSQSKPAKFTKDGKKASSVPGFDR